MRQIDRQALTEHLYTALASMDQVDAAWEGGSAAFRKVDPYSDLDLVLVVADEAMQTIFAAVETALTALSPIARRYDVPATVGYSQRFYSLRDAPEFLVLDLVCIRRSDPLLFREVELHGNGQAWLDRTGVLQETHVDPVADKAAAQARVPQLRTAFAMFQHIPTKERLRGRAVEALHFYQAMTVRYLARDLPSPVVQRIENLSFVSDLHDLQTKHAQAQEWFWQTMGNIEQHGTGGGVSAAPP